MYLDLLKVFIAGALACDRMTEGSHVPNRRRKGQGKVAAVCRPIHQGIRINPIL